MRVLEDKLVKPNCFSCFLFFILPQVIVVSVFDLQSLSAGTAGRWASCLFGSTALYPVAQKPRHRPMSEPLTLLFREQNNVCSPHSAGVEWLQRTCLPYQCFNREMWESIDGAVCWILAFFYVGFKSPRRASSFLSGDFVAGSAHKNSSAAPQQSQSILWMSSTPPEWRLSS